MGILLKTEAHQLTRSSPAHLSAIVLASLIHRWHQNRDHGDRHMLQMQMAGRMPW
jgi:hypothetical protein